MFRMQLAHRIHGDGVRFELQSKPLFGAALPIPIGRWAAEAPPPLLPAAGRLIAWADEGAATADETGIVVPHAALAALDERSGRGLQLPSACPFVLDLEHEGTLEQEGFRFRTTWRRGTGQPVAGIRRTGAFVAAGGATYRLPEPLYRLIEAVDAVNATPPQDMDQRFRIWARMQALLPEETQRSIQVDGYLRSTRIAHAARFSLALESGGDGFAFSPLLFGPAAVAPPEDTDAVPTVPSESESLLPPQQQQIFAGRRFLESIDCRPRYALGTGWYVVLDEGVQRALSVVRRAQATDRDTRRQFARNPRSFLRHALADQLDEAAIDTLFVETAEYSARIEDVGLWVPVVLPWVKRPSEPWLPETRGLRIGDHHLLVEKDDLPRVRAVIEQAIARDEPSVRWGGIEVPADQKTLAAIDELARFVEAPDGGNDVPEKEAVEEEQRERQRVVLQIASHFEDVTYRRTLQPRHNPLADASPAGLVTAAKPHQLDGIVWLQQRWREGVPGVLLADDMGLGKTLQALAFLAWLRESMQAGAIPVRPILVVAPTGLLKNWEEEHDKHLAPPGLGRPLRGYGPELRGLRAEGTGNELKIGNALLDAGRLRAADWILTTYETMRDYQHSFAAVRYAAIVFDEAQRIKSPGTLMTNAAKALNGDFVLAMTGTPVENRLADLWCIVDTVVPGLLPDLKAFSTEYEGCDDPEGLKSKLQVLKTRLTEGAEGTPPVMLRRLKADHLPGLPSKHEHTLAETMPREQADAYSSAVGAARAEAGTGGILQALHRLRGISLHPLDPEDARDDRYVELSARFRAMFDVLDRIHATQEKCLVFLEDLAMQAYLAALLQRRYRLSRAPMVINGGVGGPDRQARVNAFQGGGAGFDVMILSPRAGGVGLTLTAANHVIHLSRWWNPAVEDQCTDRIYRIGQDREVHVYLPQALHPEYDGQSFDCKLHALLDRKRALSRELLAPPLDALRDAENLYRETVGAP